MVDYTTFFLNFKRIFCYEKTDLPIVRLLSPTFGGRYSQPCSHLLYKFKLSKLTKLPWKANWQKISILSSKKRCRKPHYSLLFVIIIISMNIPITINIIGTKFNSMLSQTNLSCVLWKTKDKTDIYMANTILPVFIKLPPRIIYL